MDDAHFSHLGLCTSDLPRAARFYREALGFRELGELEIAGEPTDTLLGTKDTDLHCIFLERDGLRLELLHFRAPEATRAEAPAPMNRTGLTHLSLRVRVRELDAVLERVHAHGGRLLEGTLVRNGPTRVAFVLDPDGVRIELVAMPGDLSVLPIPRR